MRIDNNTGFNKAIAEMYMCGMSQEACARAFGIDQPRVWKILKRMRVQARTVRKRTINCQCTRYHRTQIFDERTEKKAVRLTHRIVWEENYGAIPEGYVVHHKNGDTRDNRIDNLELLTHSDHKKIHSGWIRNEEGEWMRLCRKCQCYKSEASFYVSARGTCSTRCKKCQDEHYKEYRIGYYRDNKDKIRAKAKTYRDNNKDKIRETKKLYYRKTKENEKYAKSS